MLMLSSKLLWRNWRSGELRILAGALALAVAVVAAIAVFAERLDKSLERQSGSYLAADQVVSSRFEIPSEWLGQETSMGLKSSQLAVFSSMVFSGDEMILASVKAVSPGYPLRGELEVSDEAFAMGDQVRLAQGIPNPGDVWVDSRLLPMMDLSLGDTLAIGNADFTIRQVVIREPDGSSGFGIMGPRVMMNRADLASTGVIQPGSRVVYRWLLAGDEAELKAFNEWIEPKLGDHYRLENIRDSQQNIGQALDRATRFLMLSGMIGVLLAAVAIAIAAQQFGQRHTDQVALLKSLGASATQVRQLYALQMLLLGIGASVVGLGIGELLQHGIMGAVDSLIEVELVAAGITPYITGLFTGVVCLIFFALPPLWHLPGVPPLKVLRREMSIDHVSTWARGLLGVGAVIALIWLYSGDVQLTASMVGGMGVVLGVGAVAALGLLRSGRHLAGRAGSIWRLAMANLDRHRSQSITQIMVFGCALMLLMVLFQVRTSLIDEWRLQLPEDAPNHFVMNIAPYEKETVQSLFTENTLGTNPMYPMVLGRVKARNDYVFTDDDRDKTPGALRREVNLSWAEAMAPDNELVSGQWWDEWRSQSGLPGVSVEQDTARNLSLDVGDVVTYSIGGLELQAEVSSIRTVDWNSMSPNFFFLFSPGALDAFSPNYLTSVFIPVEQKGFINRLLREYPTIVVIEVDRIIERIRTIIDQVSSGIELVLWLVLVGGVLVLVAAVNASMSARQQESGLLRALGSPSSLILGSIWLEFSSLGLFAGILATLGAETLLMALQAFVFDQPVTPHVLLWFTGPILGMIFIGALGVLACRKTVSVPPGQVLRELATN
ncbi:ABC transporter permease [Marinibactrum halimedae]|uniref:ABC3 transporter permease C-terminal domain-containing protein n=1 Tax=Marinibactrum halimedae TaxID=1444977 RepID=A0AA37T6K8_9GAMM|nr:FtsX-like permease family protein [Marinibactrum halimedae]MCD9459055.1 ABC transporter permease [Marinibactrum halimedae]GLS24656.1 hypothetical protein GCM10007877_03700 [Marinibactrum halimedae]